MNQITVNTLANGCEQLFAKVESNILLPEGMERSNCAFEHSLNSGGTGHTYVVTVNNKPPRDKKGGDYVVKLESGSFLELIILIAQYFQFDLAEFF